MSISCDFQKDMDSSRCRLSTMNAMMLYLFILSLIHHGVHTQRVFKNVDNKCVSICVSQNDLEFNGECPQTFCDRQCADQRLASRVGYPDGTEYHCALNYHNRTEYRQTWAVVQNCSKGEQPYISFFKNTMELPSNNGIIVCDKCNDSWYYNSEESTPSNTYHTCTLEKKNQCTPENHKLSCGIPWEDRTKSDGFCRCDYEHGYAPIGGDVPSCFYSKEECDIKECPSGNELVSNYSCVSVCPQGYYRDNTSRQCLPVNSGTTHRLQEVTTTETTSAPSLFAIVIGIVSSTVFIVLIFVGGTALWIRMRTKTDADSSTTNTTHSGRTNDALEDFDLVTFETIHHKEKTDPAKTNIDADSSTTNIMNSGHTNAGLEDIELLTFDTKHRKGKNDPAKTKLEPVLLHFYTSESKHWNRFVEDCIDIKEIWIQCYELLEMCKIKIDIKMQTDELQLFDAVAEDTGKINFAFYDFKMKDIFESRRLNRTLRPAVTSTHQEISNSVEPFIIVCYQQDIPAVSNVLKQKRSTKYCVLVIDEGKDVDGVDRDIGVLSETFNSTCVIERCDTSENNIAAAIEKLLTRWVYTILTTKIKDLINLSSDGKDDQKQLDETMFLLQIKERTEVRDRSQNDTKPFLDNESVRQFLSELIEESRALYDRADLPEGDTPPFPPAPKKISHQAREDLNKIQGLLAYGERFGTLNIFLSNDLETVTKVEEAVHHVLQKWDINKVVFRYGSTFIKPYMKPGDKVFEVGCGSLACFARETGGRVYALLSKHVAEGNKDTLFMDGEDVGKLLPTDKHTIDIAAALIHESFEKKCHFMFQTEQGQEKASTLYDCNNDSNSLSGKRVHLHGAMTSPGFGKVSIENLYVLNENYVGVLFEDRKSGKGSNQPFCVGGDSGSMVLAYCSKDDELKVIGMIIGEQLKNHIKICVRPIYPDEKAEACLVTNKSYVGFKITDGLKELEEHHRIRLSLCCDHVLGVDSGISTPFNSDSSSTDNSPVLLHKPSSCM
ncbi:uncharacterized protein LOC128245409 isoform X2 [Mya arenaria]|uniref:uncharacterized protein LOC128245409 isoform X2 n=2 Tax=Mya arenaria TaxID=6604 RepID=UPI0022E7CA47|nr:uncharacterized protein LOC128245409 isoform X2 [Mya arenaria]